MIKRAAGEWLAEVCERAAEQRIDEGSE